jgi:ABC-type sugar transport system ATPase subunit
MIKLENITKRFGSRPILLGINLEIDKGQLLILTGPSGSGKSTIIRIAAGLETPEEGNVYIDGNLATSARLIAIKPFERKIGMVFQDFALWPHMTVRQNIVYGKGSKNRARPESDAELVDLCQILKIESLINSYPAKLSGGEKQRVALARALAAKPAILLLDEPMSNIDRAHKTALLDYLEQYRSLNNTTVIYVTHSQSDIDSLKGRVMVIENGMIADEN